MAYALELENVTDELKWMEGLENARPFIPLLSSQPFKWHTTRTLSVEILLISNWRTLFPMIHRSGFFIHPEPANIAKIKVKPYIGHIYFKNTTIKYSISV